MNLDTLGTRERRIALFERYGALLTGPQREVLELHLRQDWSLAEIAARRQTSRAAVHDALRRAEEAVEAYERRLGLLAEAVNRRREREVIARELASLRERLARLELRTLDV